MIDVIAWALAAAGPASPLPPLDKWAVDYQKDMCLVTRPFGRVDAPVFFAIKPPIMLGSGAQTIYIVTPNPGGGVRRGRATLALPSGMTKAVDYVSWPTKDKKLRGYEVVADPEFATAFGDAPSISITAGKDAFVFSTGKAKSVLEALQTCNDDLFKSWGIDPAARATAFHGNDPANWFPEDSYPSGAKRRGATGRTVIVLTVSPQGRPTACRVVVKADVELDTTTCDLAMRHAKFEPATTRRDQYSVLAVRWELWDD